VLIDKGLEGDEELVPWGEIFELICCSCATALDESINLLNKIVIIIIATANIMAVPNAYCLVIRAADDYSSNLFLCMDYTHPCSTVVIIIIYIDTVFIIANYLTKIPYSIIRNTTFEPRLGLRFISLFVRSCVDNKTICTIPDVLILATGIPTALAAHTPAYLYGFKLGKNVGLRGYYDVMNDCSNRPYLSTNVTGARKNFTSLQEVNECD